VSKNQENLMLCLRAI